MIRSAQRRASVTMTTLFLETNRISIPDAFMIPRLLIVKRKGTSWGSEDRTHPVYTASAQNCFLIPHMARCWTRLVEWVFEKHLLGTYQLSLEEFKKKISPDFEIGLHHAQKETILQDVEIMVQHTRTLRNL